MAHVVIDATDAILGRMCTYIAEEALSGNQVSVVNCEKAIITGKKDYIYEHYLHARTRGQPRQGVYIHRNPDRYVRRVIRGMLPKDKARGVVAFQRVKCYRGLPDAFKNEKLVKPAHSDKSRLSTVRYITVGDLCQRLGSRV